jgi:hypothetical protein
VGYIAASCQGRQPQAAFNPGHFRIEIEAQLNSLCLGSQFRHLRKDGFAKQSLFRLSTDASSPLSLECESHVWSNKGIGPHFTG